MEALDCRFPEGERFNLPNLYAPSIVYVPSFLSFICRIIPYKPSSHWVPHLWKHPICQRYYGGNVGKYSIHGAYWKDGSGPDDCDGCVGAAASTARPEGDVLILRRPSSTTSIFFEQMLCGKGAVLRVRVELPPNNLF